MRPRRLYSRIYRHFIGMLLMVGVLSAALFSLTSHHAMPARPGLLGPLMKLMMVLVVVAIATRPLARHISRPVERLTEANRRLGGGDLSYRIPLTPDLCRHERHGRIDELVRLIRSWNEMAERIERLVRGHKELLANVSHELRSPLARIRVALALLPRDAAVEARLSDVETDLDELERLIEDVLTASRLEQSGLPVHLERVAVRPLLDLLAERAAHAPGPKDQQVRVEGDPDLASLSLYADAALLKRALWNLLDNAGKYGAAPITLAAHRVGTAGDRIAFSVTDHGPGIPPEERQRVLQPFYRVGKARTPASGFGLGLTLAQRIAQVHGGDLRIEAPEGGQGCRVILEVPLSPGLPGPE